MRANSGERVFLILRPAVDIKMDGKSGILCERERETKGGRWERERYQSEREIFFRKPLALLTERSSTLSSICIGDAPALTFA